MAIYLTFKNYDNSLLMPSVPTKHIANVPGQPGLFSLQHYFEALSCSFDSVQTLNIGSQSTGAGAGKVTFNPFVVYLQSLNTFTGQFFQRLCSGTPFEFVNVYRTEMIGGTETLVDFFTMGLVALKEMQPALDSSGTQWAISFEFGALAMGTSVATDGKAGTWEVLGWNRVRNVAWDGKVVIK